MKFLPVIFVLLISLSTFSLINCQEDGEGDQPQGGHDQPPSSEGSQEGNDQNNKNGTDQGYSQGYNQGVKPYSYGYNSGIKPYSYNFYQPYGGKPQIVHNDPEGKGEKGKDGKTQTPPPIPVNIDFPELREFGLGPINIPPPPPQGQGQQQGQPQVPFNFPPQQQPHQQHQQHQQQPQTPPPFNFAEYGIPTDIGTATLTAAGNPYGQQQQPQQTQPFLGLGGGGNPGGSPAGDDFGIFGNGNQNNNNNNLNIPILEDGNNNNNQNQLGIPLFGGGGGNSNNNNNDFNFGNDFNVAASDFAPFNFRNFVPEELTSISPESLGIPPPDAGNRGQLNPHSGQQEKQLTKPLQPQLLQKVFSKNNGVVTSSGTGNKDEKTVDKKDIDLQRRRMMYAVKEKNLEQAKKRTRRQIINERPKEKLLKEDPNSAWYILNMAPEFTNPNQGVYSYYPAYRMPS